MTTTSCPSCGATREGASRFCDSCGLDYWRAADGATDAAKTDAAEAPWERAKRPPGGPSPILMVAGGVALLGAAAAVTVAFMMSLGDTPPPAQVAATPSQPAAETAERRLANAFFRLARSPEAAFSVRGHGTLTIDGLPEPFPPMEVKSTTRIHGSDWSADLAIIQEDQAIVAGEVVVVDGAAYARVGEDWERGDLARSQLQPINPFARISTVTEIEQVGTDATGDVELVHLRVTKWLGGTDFHDLLRGVAIVDRQSTLDIVVDTDGVPISADLEVEVRASDGVETAILRIVTEYRFSDWGTVDPIEAPG